MCHLLTKHLTTPALEIDPDFLKQNQMTEGEDVFIWLHTLYVCIAKKMDFLWFFDLLIRSVVVLEINR